MRTRTLRLAAVLMFTTAAAAAADDAVGNGNAACSTPRQLLSIGPGLPNVAARVARREPLTIVAIGSSSTQGVGASSPALSYPSRLEAELRARFPDIPVRVLNRGKGGEEAPQMLARIERDVIAERPDLVIWQLGTNAVLRHDDVSYEEELIERGIKRLQDGGAEVVLMDMQYAPRVITRPASPAMERLLADIAKRERVGLFRRFAIMQQWHAEEPAGAPQMVGPDGLHMNDRGYGCLAVELAEALAANWRSAPSPAAPAAGRVARMLAPEVGAP